MGIWILPFGPRSMAELLPGRDQLLSHRLEPGAEGGRTGEPNWSGSKILAASRRLAWGPNQEWPKSWAYLAGGPGFGTRRAGWGAGITEKMVGFVYAGVFGA